MMGEHNTLFHSLMLGSILFLGLASLGKVTEAGQPSVQYIKSTLYGNFFVAKGKTIPVENATHVFNGFNNCTCRNACWTMGNKCKAWSLIQAEGTTECRLAKLGPETTHVYDEPQATYFFKESSIGGTYEFANDGLLYVILDETSDHGTGKSRCASIPGHRLSIAKTLKTFDYLKGVTPDQLPVVVLDVLKPSPLVWGDGTPVAETELDETIHFLQTEGASKIYFSFWKGKLDDCANLQFKIICQANPIGLPW